MSIRLNRISRIAPALQQQYRFYGTNENTTNQKIKKNWMGKAAAVGAICGIAGLEYKLESDWWENNRDVIVPLSNRVNYLVSLDVQYYKLVKEFDRLNADLNQLVSENKALVSESMLLQREYAVAQNNCNQLMVKCNESRGNQALVDLNNASIAECSQLSQKHDELLENRVKPCITKDLDAWEKKNQCEQKWIEVEAKDKQILRKMNEISERPTQLQKIIVDSCDSLPNITLKQTCLFPLILIFRSIVFSAKMFAER